MTGFDIAVLVLIGMGAITGFMRGFVQEVLALAAWVVSMVAIRNLHTPLAEGLQPHIGTESGAAVLAFAAPPGAYNIADDEPASQNAVIEEACRLLAIAPPPLQSLDEAGLSPMARAFYAENRRVANGNAKRTLGWKPRFPTYREGLRSLLPA